MSTVTVKKTFAAKDLASAIGKTPKQTRRLIRELARSTNVGDKRFVVTETEGRYVWSKREFDAIAKRISGEFAKRESVCDERCIDSTSKHCNCSCEGVNHGAGLVKTSKKTSKKTIAPTNTDDDETDDVIDLDEIEREPTESELAAIEASA